VTCLTGWLLERLQALRHGNGRALVVLYGPGDVRRRGGTITFNLRDPDGAMIDHTIVEERASQRRISIRTGCFCNPGAGELALGLSRGEIESCLAAPAASMTQDEFRRCIDGRSTGAVRVSLGLVSSFADVAAFARFIESFAEPSGERTS
jgi:selenocysteine lyase/cysteine desulfurase